MPEVTILYYTSNRENPIFEERTRNTWLKHCGDLPIISISQQPINLGKNICVGDVGASGFNMFRQIQHGLREVTTPFVLSAEADCLYPPSYFKSLPPRLDVCYRCDNVYLMGYKREYFWRKPLGSTVAQIVGRDFYLRTLTTLFNGAPEWCIEEKSFPKERTHRKQQDVFLSSQIEYYQIEEPIISFKTGKGMRQSSPCERIEIPELPYWGTGPDVRRAYFQ